MKASLEEGARFQGDLEEDLLVGVREGSAKEGWAFKSGVVWRRAFRRRAVWDKEKHQEWCSWDVGCLQEGERVRDEPEGVSQPNCRGLCKKEFGVFHELCPYSIAFNARDC